MFFRSLFLVLVLEIVGFFAFKICGNSDNITNKDTTREKSVTGNKITPDVNTGDLRQLDIFDFGPDYSKYLDKADKAYNLGFFRRAKKYYSKAAEINPNSLYIKYRLNEINNYKGNFNKVVFFFNFDKPDLLIQSLTFFVVYFIFSMFIILLIILGNRRRMENLEKRKQALKELYQELLVDYLFTDDNEGTIIHRFKKVISSDFNRKILIDQMIDLSINLTGDAKEKLRQLYLSLSLDKDSIIKVYSYRWHIKVKGFHELAFMDITDANEEIERCLQSNNDIVRMEAQLALVRLNHEDSFGFLDRLEKPFTLWEQLTIYETITFHNLPIPKFDRWLFSKNKSIILFSIRMIDIFKQKEAYENLFWMLVNEDWEIRYHTIRVIGNLRIKDALPHLKRLYKTENYNNCLAIIQAMAKMPDKSILKFLMLVIDKEDDVQIQIEAAIAINNLGEDGKKTLEKMLQSDYKNYQIIIKHILDKRIN
jgi:tetratricopeptide (TPR) repeat protein